MTYLNATKYIRNAPKELPEEIVGTRIKRLWEHLGNPGKPLKYLRLAGSNGKTVCAEMLLSILKCSGHTAGCFITPIRAEIRESILIGGTPLSFEDTARYVEQVYRAEIEIGKQLKKQASLAEGSDENGCSSPAEFILTDREILLSAALLAFHEAECQICLIESDHNHSDPTRFLPPPFATAICGTIPSEDKRDIQKIRAYIAHGTQEIVSAPQNQDAYRVISETCAAVNARLTIPTRTEVSIERLTLKGTDFSYRNQSYHLGLCGKFQIMNATVVLEIVSMLIRRGYELSEDSVKMGLSRVKLPSRFEVLSVSPTIIADSTHSSVAIQTVCDSMLDFAPLIGKKIRLCLPDEDLADAYCSVLELLDYTVTRVILHTPDRRIKDTVCACLTELVSDDILLISGPAKFTSVVRYEILKILGF